MTTFFLVIHILSAIAGLGPAFVFPFVGAMMERDAAAVTTLSRATTLIADRLITPIALSMAVTGVVLIYLLDINLTRNAWLGASIIIYVAMMAAVLFFQRPAAARLATLAATNSASTGSRGIERAALMRRLKFGSMGITTAILIIAVLMIWRPGGTL